LMRGILGVSVAISVLIFSPSEFDSLEIMKVPSFQIRVNVA
jgi:hypothetical protein